MDCSVVTCVTGNFNKVHYTDVDSAFVCTTIMDDSFKSHANSNGWEIKQLPFNHTYDLKEGTRQSKYVKFLKFFVPETGETVILKVSANAIRTIDKNGIASVLAKAIANGYILV